MQQSDREEIYEKYAGNWAKTSTMQTNVININVCLKKEWPEIDIYTTQSLKWEKEKKTIVINKKIKRLAWS